MANLLFNLPASFFNEKEEKKPVFFYGAGGIGKLLARHSEALSVIGLEPDYYIDKNPDKIGSTIRTYSYYLKQNREIPIISPIECRELGLDNPIIVTVRNATPVITELEELGFTNVWFLPMSDGDIKNDGLKKIIYDSKEKIEWIDSRLGDDISREIFRCITGLRGGKESGDKTLSELKSEERYMPRALFSFGSDAVIIDAGALDGDTALDFAEETGYTYKCIYSFEPNPKMFSKLYERKLPNHKIVTKALASNCGVTRFMIDENESYLSTAASKISDLGNYEVEMVSLDSMKEELLDPTYIKMDIEGAELDALIGMEQLITENHPILAVCIYHKPLDILEIPEYLMKKYPFYKFYIRHHSENNYDTVLYCVP